MTACSAHPRRGRTFGLFRVLAPVLTALAFMLALVADKPAAAAGQGMMLLAVTLYVYRLKGLPVTARPPVCFSVEACAYAALLAIGVMIWAASFAGMAGAFAALLAAASCTVWMRSAPGLAWRNSLIGTV